MVLVKKIQSFTLKGASRVEDISFFIANTEGIIKGISFRALNSGPALSERGSSIHPSPWNGLGTTSPPLQTCSSFTNSTPWNFWQSTLKKVFFSPSFFNLHPPQWETERTPKHPNQDQCPGHILTAGSHKSPWLRGNGHKLLKYLWFGLGSLKKIGFWSKKKYSWMQ